MADSGSCLCGAVRFVVEAAPLMAGHCHCRACQKSSGAGHMTHVAVPEAALRVEGEVRGFQCRADSGALVTRSFCPTCGSRLFGRSDAMPGVVTVNATALDAAAGIVPGMTVFAARAQPWDAPAGGLPCFDGMPPGVADGPAHQSSDSSS